MKITKTCEWCGKTKSLLPSDAHGKVFFTCSPECRGKMMGKIMREKWEALTPEEHKAWSDKIGKNQNGKGLIDYHKALRPARVSIVVQKMMNPNTEKGDRNGNKGHSEKPNPRLDADEWMPRGTCTMIAAHHEMLKHDPERLTTEFMQKMCGVDCKCKVNKDKLPMVWKGDFKEIEEEIEETIKREESWRR